MAIDGIGFITAGEISDMLAPGGAGDLSGHYQPRDTTLDSLAALAWTAGFQIPTFSAADTVAFRSVGAASATDILDRAAGDARYATTGSGVLSFNTRTGAVTLTSGDITTALTYTPQPIDSDLTTIAGLTATTDNFLVSVASAWASRTPAQVRTTLGLVIGTNVQAWDADLDTWATVTPASGVATFLATPSSANLIAAMTDETGTGACVFATSPTLVTPVLGTPSSGTLTSCTGLPISTGVSGLAANVATFLATPTSANLAAAVTNETGSGALVFATSPALVTPALGTPASGALTNCTLYNCASLAGLSSGMANFLSSASSANLRSTCTDETGTGSLVFATSPTLVTPLLGTPTSGTLTNCTGLLVSGITASTTLGLGVGTVELGHASDTTIARVSAGVVSIEGVNVVTTSSTDTLTNKTLTSPTMTAPVLGTPASGTLTNCTGLPAAGLVASTSQAVGFGTIELGDATDTTLARASAGNVNIEGNIVYRAGGTDVPVADGGTGSSTAGGARTNLGLGTSAVLDTGTSGTKVALTDGANTWSGAQTYSAQQITTMAGSTANPQIYLNGTTNNWIGWAAGTGVAAPSLTTRSLGTKLVLDPAVSALYVDYALGIAASVLWLSVPSTAESFKFYGGTAVAATLTGAGLFTTTGALVGTNITAAGNTTGNAATATALATGRTIAMTGDLVWTSPSFDGTGNVTAAGTLATVNSNVGSFGSATQVATFTVNGKGLTTAAANVTITPAVGSITGLGTGVATALAVNTNAAGGMVPRSGCRATKTANQTGIDFTAGANLTWDAEAYDDNSWHDTVTNNSRLTVPTGVTRVSVGCSVNMNNVTANLPVSVTIQKNGSGIGVTTVTTSSIAPTISVCTDIDCVATDYFEINLFVNDASADVKTIGSNFWIRAI